MQVKHLNFLKPYISNLFCIVNYSFIHSICV